MNGKRRISAYEMALSATVVVLIVGSLMQAEMRHVEQRVEIVLDTIQATPPACQVTGEWPLPREGGWMLYTVLCPEGRLPIEGGGE